MKLPVMLRSTHDELTAILTAQIAGLNEERKMLLDRLAALGLGGPIFNIPQEAAPEPEEPEASIDPDEELRQILRLKHRPTQMARALTLKARRDYNKRHTPPKVAWIPDARIDAALDAAEEEGRSQA